MPSPESGGLRRQKEGSLISSNDRCREAAALIRNGYADVAVRIRETPDQRVTVPLDDDSVAAALDDAADTGTGHWYAVARAILDAWRGAGCPGKTADFDPRDWDRTWDGLR